MISIKRFLLLVLAILILTPSVCADNWCNESWSYRIPLNLTEEIGINRTFYVMEKNLTFVSQIHGCEKIRITECLNGIFSNYKENEVPFEVLFGDNSTWCNIRFIINITGNSWKQYFVYYGNKEAEESNYGNYKRHYFSELPYMPTSENLRDIDIISCREAYVVGGDNLSTTTGRAIKWNGSNWYGVPVFGGISGPLGGVGFWDSEEGWAAGDHEVRGSKKTDEIFKWNKEKQRWEEYFSPGWHTLNDLDTLNQNFSVVGGAWNSVLNWDGSNWKDVSSGFNYHAGRVDIISENDAWMTGKKDDTYRCGLTHWDGDKWEAEGCPTNRGHGTAIDCWNSSLCFAATSEGEIFRFNGLSWSVFQNPTDFGIYGIKFTSPTEAWSCGENGTIMKWDGDFWYFIDSTTNKTLGNRGYSVGMTGDGIDMLNSSYGWIIGEDGIILHRGSVSVDVGEEQEVPTRTKLILEQDKVFYLADDFGSGILDFHMKVFQGNLSLDNLEERDFEVSVKGQEMNFILEEFGEGEYSLVFEDIYGQLGELGMFNLTVKLVGNFSAENSTIFQLLKLPGREVIVTDTNWKNILAASSTGRPVLVGEPLVNLEDLDIDVLVLGNTGIWGSEKVYRVNDRKSLQAIFLNQEKKVKVDDMVSGVFGARLANSMNRILVFEGKCKENCLDLSNKSLEEMEQILVRDLGRVNYFVLANKNRDNSLLVAQMSIFRNGFPIFLDLDNISYPEPGDRLNSYETFNQNNQVEPIREKLKDKIARYGKLEKNYTFGIMPKLAIVGTEYDVPYSVVPDMGLEDFVQEPSGDDLWIKTDNFYGDINDDGFMDLATGRINKELEEGTWQILSVRLFEEKEELNVGILAEYNQPAGLDLLTFGGSMMNGYMAHLNLRGYEAERLVEKRYYSSGEIEDELLEEIKKIILKELNKKLFWVFTKLEFSQKLLYILLERDWIGWEIPGVPHYLEEITMERSVDLLEGKDFTLFFGPGDASQIFFYDDMGEDRDIYFDPYPGPELDLGNLEKTGFLFLDYSYSAAANLPEKSPGFLGNTGIMHEVASRNSLLYFLESTGHGVGQALAESKNSLARIEMKDDEGPKPREKEYFEKVLLTDPALKLTEEKIPKGFFSAKREGNYFYDEVEIKPEINGSGCSFPMLVPNKPITPVYTGSMIIPSGAEVTNFKVSKKSKVFDNVSFPLYSDKYYSQENFSGIFPKEEWWKRERTYLDGRKEIIFSVPVVYDSENMTAFVNDFVFRVEYNADLEITNFYTADITEGESQIFYLEIYSEEEREAEAYLKFCGQSCEEISKFVELEEGENLMRLLWNGTEEPGNYQAQVTVSSGSIHIGPRALNFRVLERPSLLIQTSKKIVQVWDSFSEKVFRTLSWNRIELNNTNPEITKEQWVENGTKLTRFETNDFVLTVKEDSGTRETVFTSASGMIIVNEFSGRVEEIIRGNQEVKKDFEKLKKLID